MSTGRICDSRGCYYDEFIVENVIPDFSARYYEDQEKLGYTIDYSEKKKDIEDKRAIYVRDSDTHRTSYLLLGRVRDSRFFPKWVLTPVPHLWEYNHLQYFKDYYSMQSESLDEEELSEALEWDIILSNIFEEVNDVYVELI